MSSKFGLGKGLAALMPSATLDDESAFDVSGDAGGADNSRGVLSVPISDVKPNPNQPRKTFDPESLDEIAASIKEHGIIQPVIVERDGEDGFVIVAGERRWRAAELAGLTKLPVIIRNMSSQERLEVSIIENVQRSDLDPLEEAAAYKRLAEEFGLSQEEISGRVGKNRSTLANSMRLLKLPPEMQEALKSQKLSAGHARAILSLSQAAGQNALFKEIMDKSLSVREAEKRAEQLKGQAPAGNVTFKMQKHTIRNSELGGLEQKFIEALGTKVVLDGSINSGTIKIDYFSMDDLDRIYEIVSGAPYGE